MPNPRDDEGQQEIETRASEADAESVRMEGENHHGAAAQQAGSAGDAWATLARARAAEGETMLGQGIGHDAKTRLKDAAEAFERSAEAYTRAARCHRAAGSAAEAGVADALARTSRQEAARLYERRGQLLFEQGDVLDSLLALATAERLFDAAGDAVGGDRAGALTSRVGWFVGRKKVACGDNNVPGVSFGDGIGFSREGAEASARKAAHRDMRRFIEGLRINSSLCPEDCRRAVIVPGPFVTRIEEGSLQPKEYRFGVGVFSRSIWKAGAICTCDIAVRCERPDGG